MDHSATSKRIEEILRSELSAEITILDESAKHAGHAGAKKGGHFFAHIRSPLFVGKSPLERQRMVFAALGSMMENEIHAFSMKCEAVE